MQKIRKKNQYKRVEIFKCSALVFETCNKEYKYNYDAKKKKKKAKQVSGNI